MSADTSRANRQTRMKETHAYSTCHILLFPACRSPTTAPISPIPHGACGREGHMRDEASETVHPGCMPPHQDPLSRNRGIMMCCNFRHGPVSHPGSRDKDPCMPIWTDALVSSPAIPRLQDQTPSFFSSYPHRSSLTRQTCRSRKNENMPVMAGRRRRSASRHS